MGVYTHSNRVLYNPNLHPKKRNQANRKKKLSKDKKDGEDKEELKIITEQYAKKLRLKPGLEDIIPTDIELAGMDYANVQLMKQKGVPIKRKFKKSSKMLEMMNVAAKEVAEIRARKKQLLKRGEEVQVVEPGRPTITDESKMPEHVREYIEQQRNKFKEFELSPEEIKSIISEWERIQERIQEEKKKLEKAKKTLEKLSPEQIEELKLLEKNAITSIDISKQTMKRVEELARERFGDQYLDFKKGLSGDMIKPENTMNIINAFLLVKGTAGLRSSPEKITLVEETLSLLLADVIGQFREKDKKAEKNGKKGSLHGMELLKLFETKEECGSLMLEIIEKNSSDEVVQKLLKSSSHIVDLNRNENAGGHAVEKHITCDLGKSIKRLHRVINGLHISASSRFLTGENPFKIAQLGVLISFLNQKNLKDVVDWLTDAKNWNTLTLRTDIGITLGSVVLRGVNGNIQYPSTAPILKIVLTKKKQHFIITCFPVLKP